MIVPWELFPIPFLLFLHPKLYIIWVLALHNGTWCQLMATNLVKSMLLTQGKINDNYMLDLGSSLYNQCNNQSVTSRLETSQYRDFSQFFESIGLGLENFGLKKKSRYRSR